MTQGDPIPFEQEFPEAAERWAELQTTSNGRHKLREMMKVATRESAVPRYVCRACGHEFTLPSPRAVKCPECDHNYVDWITYDDWLYYRDNHKPVTVDKVKVGRNNPCPCGSGKKHKKCCLGKD